MLNASEPKEMGNILVVDDMPDNLRILVGMLKVHGHHVRPVPSGTLALQAAAHEPPDLILLDINMPEMDGFEVCARLKADKDLQDIPVIFLSALTETQDKVKAFRFGGVDYIAKPFNLEEVKVRVETHLSLHRLRVQLERHNCELHDLVAEKVREIYNSQMATILALSKLAEYRDDDTGKHLERVRAYCRSLCDRLNKESGLDDRVKAVISENIFNASPLHDIGKVGISDRILLKRGLLSPEEFELIKTHTLIGAQTLEAVHRQYPQNSFIKMGIIMARSHHEKWDGSGYPDGLKGTDIPLPARIMAVADAYDTMRSRRPYKEPRSHEVSSGIIREDSGSHFDPEVVAVFDELKDEFKSIGNGMDDGLE